MRDRGPANGRYVLDGRTPVEEPDLMTFGRWMETADRCVRYTIQEGVSVSTVFLGLDYQFGDGPPLLFETMVFGGPLNGDQRRYSTWEEAELGHGDMVRLAISRAYVK